MIDWEHEQFIKNFEENLLDGKVNPYDYLQSTKYKRCRIILAKHGYCVDELIANNEDDVTATLIQHGYGKEHYKELAQSQHTLIRATLAGAGYYPDVFIFDEYANVRMTVIDNYPEYFRKLLDDADSTKLIQHVLWEYPTPTIDDLERHKFQCLKTNTKTPYLDEKNSSSKGSPDTIRRNNDRKTTIFPKQPLVGPKYDIKRNVRFRERIVKRNVIKKLNH